MRTRLWCRKPEGKKLLQSHKPRWEDNIKIDIKEIGREDVDWIDLVMIMNFRLPQNAEYFLASWGTVSLSTNTVLHVDNVNVLCSYCTVQLLFLHYLHHAPIKPNRP